METFCCMWSFLHNALAKREVNQGSQSEMILLGKPNHRYTCSIYNWATPSVVMVVVQGRNVAALVHLWSTMVSIASFPLLFGSWVMKSIDTTLKGHAFGGGGMW